MVSVIVATKNREKSLKICLEALKKQSFKDFEVVVERGGESLAGARQFGFEKAKGEIIIYIDDDCEVTKGWLKNILAPFKDSKVGGVSGPTLVNREEMKNRDVFIAQNQKSKIKNQKLDQRSKIINFFWEFVGWFYNKVILEGREKEVGRIVKSGMWTMGSNLYQKSKIKNPRRMLSSSQRLPASRSRGAHLRGRQKSKIFSVDYLEACNMAMRRDLIKRVGGFDLNFKGTSEWCEVDLAMRVKELGYKLVFNPRAILYHHVSREGVFSRRVNGPERMKNFIRYYLRNRDSISGGVLKYFKFLLAVLFMEGYFVYKAIEEKNIKWVFP